VTTHSLGLDFSFYIVDIKRIEERNVYVEFEDGFLHDIPLQPAKMMVTANVLPSASLFVLAEFGVVNTGLLKSDGAKIRIKANI